MGGLTALAVVVVAYTLVASKLDRWWITGPMVFVAAGAILGPGGLDVLPFSLGNETVLTITELTLALLLFSDASTVRLKDVEGDAGLPRRLLFVGLPLTIVAGALLAYLMFPEIGWAAAALVATILAPTDAALGLAVVTNRSVPVRIRRALNVESGLNDGIATPFVTLFIAVVAAEEGLGDTAWGLEALKQIGLAIVAAVVVGYLGGRLLAFANERGWTSEVSEQIAILALALLAYGGSVAIGGNGFIAAFAGGILFGAVTRRRLAEPVQFTETLGLSASFLVWAIFGALFVGELLSRGPLSSTHRLRDPEPHGDQDGAGRDLARSARGCVRPPWRSWAGSARAGWPRSCSRCSPWRRSSVAATVRCSWRPSPGPSCSPWSCTASRRPRWPLGTGRRSRRPARSRRSNRPVSRGSGFTTVRAATATDGSRYEKRHERPLMSTPKHHEGPHERS